MLRRLVPLAVAAVAVSTLAIVPVPTAQAAAASTCDGRTADFTGDGDAEKFTLSKTRRVVNSHGGNDVIEMVGSRPDFLDFPATVCMGSGDDILRSDGSGPEAVPVRYLDGGKGFDRAEIYICFEGDAGPKWTIRDVERITVVNCLD